MRFSPNHRGRFVSAIEAVGAVSRVPVGAVPEPGSGWLTAVGLALLAAFGRRRVP